MTTFLACQGALSCERTTPPDGAAAPARLQPGASERRFAVVVGNNQGPRSQTRLRHAEQDAVRVARVLTELGHFAERDVFLHQGRSAAELRLRLGDLRRTIAQAKVDSPASRALLVLYFSGHSDGVALELGDDRLPFTDLRSLLSATGADVRIGLLDTCKSGAAIGIKGGTLTDGYDLGVTALPALMGEAFLSASRSDEMALESREIEASIFSMHLVSGLRGAADADVDGVVTLDELYRHTSAGTSGAAAETLYGTQTPAYDYRLVGQGQLVLSFIGDSSRYVFLPAGFDRIVISDETTGEPQAEVRLGSTVRIALPLGGYRLRGRRDGRWWNARRRLQEGRPTTIAANDFELETASGDEVDGAARAASDAARAAEIAAATTANLAKSRLGGQMPAPLPRTSPYFCEGTEGAWKGCRGSGCTVCVEMVRRYENYFRNHPNCLANSDCKARYFTCSANCPPPTIADSCESLPTGWLGCSHGCGVCNDVLTEYPHYYENRPNCIPTPGRCKDAPGPCGAACPPPTAADR